MILLPLYLQPLSGRRWRVVADFAVATEALGFILIPQGFICDLNSIPRFLWWESTPSDYAEAGVTHDYLYDQQAPKLACDQTYAEILTALGMPAWRVWLRYHALRLFGGPAYRSHRHS